MEKRVLMLQVPDSARPEELEMVASRVQKAVRKLGWIVIVTNHIETLSREEALHALGIIRNALEPISAREDRKP